MTNGENRFGRLGRPVPETNNEILDVRKKGENELCS